MTNKQFRRTRLVLIVSLLCCASAFGQTNVSPTGQTTSATITAVAAADRVRITAPASILQMRVEIYDPSGAKVWDSEIRGNVFDWRLQDGQVQRLTVGDYICLVTVKNIAGRIAQKIGVVRVAEKGVTVGPAEIVQLSPQQTQAIGPVEENSSWTILDNKENQTATVIAHDGTDGQIVRGRGAFSFRLGDFYSGNDKEQMRLTEEGNLGIGTAKPKARLDVAGTVRAGEGFMFSDGSTLKVNDKGVLTRTSADGTNTVTSTTQNRIAKFTDNAGTVGDSVVLDTGTGLQLTAAPDGLVDTNLLYLNSTNGTTGVLAGSTPNYGAANGPFFAMRGNTYTTFPNQRGLFTISAGNVANPQGDDGSVKFNTGGDQLRMVIRPNGNVGIGTNNPGAKLDVAGDINTSTQYKISTQTVLRVGLPTAGNVFVGSDAGFNNNGAGNSFFGFNAGASATPTTYSGNTFIGDSTNGSAGVNSATAIGSRAQVTQSNSLVLGSIKGVNSATSSTNVGIGITAPIAVLHVVGSPPPATVSFSNGTDATRVLQVLGGDGGASTDPTAVGGRGAGVFLISGNGGSAPEGGSGGDVVARGGTGGLGTSSGNGRGGGSIILGGGNAGTGHAFGGFIDLQGGFNGDLNPGFGGIILQRSGGNVGIGTATPQQTLHVNGLEVLSTGSSGGFKFRDRDSTSSANDWVWYANTGVAHFWRPGIGDMINVLNNGNVGIGTSSPDQTLSLGVGTASKPGGGSWAVFSDERLKNIRGRFTPGLKAVMQLQPIRYEYKPNNALDIKSEGESVGFSAQAVQKIIPEAVIKNDKGYLLINNDPIIWTMLNAIKEQQSQIERQQRTVTQQQKQIESLKKLVSRSRRRASECK